MIRIFCLHFQFPDEIEKTIRFAKRGFFVGFVMILEEILRIRSEQSPDGPVRHRECQRLGLAGKSMQRVGALKIYERMAFT